MLEATKKEAKANPIFAAIKAHRDAVDRINNAGRVSDEIADAFSDNVSDAWRAFVNTKPATMKGILAFVDYGVECAGCLD